MTRHHGADLMITSSIRTVPAAEVAVEPSGAQGLPERHRKSSEGAIRTVTVCAPVIVPVPVKSNVHETKTELPIKHVLPMALAYEFVLR